ncbi:caldesmon, putative [Entamoeba dispar SAW760]|uniref:Caldesmon, putative n=1 Tax=Entamoeba dispar (strain ATCC PRA-260 / SAW760) TaxID=370354 RepID=B0EFA7_ENTDS|nr:caldesmon, putative [Entamoeba dispar SAW760]EDR26837.1 caldesmon, putative [Entamoeba dispar SAW760]|eukprot:EDR26837.1 caldesmon, putative [Entamoeba dispar SAW760]
MSESTKRIGKKTIVWNRKEDREDDIEETDNEQEEEMGRMFEREEEVDEMIDFFEEVVEELEDAIEKYGKMKKMKKDIKANTRSKIKEMEDLSRQLKESIGRQKGMMKELEDRRKERMEAMERMEKAERREENYYGKFRIEGGRIEFSGINLKEKLIEKEFYEDKTRGLQKEKVELERQIRKIEKEFEGRELKLQKENEELRADKKRLEESVERMKGLSPEIKIKKKGGKGDSKEKEEEEILKEIQEILKSPLREKKIKQEWSREEMPSEEFGKGVRVQRRARTEEVQRNGGTRLTGKDTKERVIIQNACKRLQFGETGKSEIQFKSQRRPGISPVKETKIVITNLNDGSISMEEYSSIDQSENSRFIQKQSKLTKLKTLLLFIAIMVFASTLIIFLS